MTTLHVGVLWASTSELGLHAQAMSIFAPIQVRKVCSRRSSGDRSPGDVGSNLNGTAVAGTFSDARSVISSENKTHALDFIRGALHQEPV
jgi:hypothetical protein